MKHRLGLVLCSFGWHRPTGRIQWVPITWMRYCPCGQWATPVEYLQELRKAKAGGESYQ